MKIVNGEKIDRAFLIKSYEIKSKKNGGNYLDMTLLDKDNCIKGKLWSVSGKPDFVSPELRRIVGTVSEYSGQLQIIINQILPVSDSIDISEFVPCENIDVDNEIEYIYGAIQSFGNNELKVLTEAIVNQYEDKLRYTCGAVSCHHSGRYGLLSHTAEMLHTAQEICKIYPCINRDLLLAGVILHDIAKIEEIDSCELGIAEKYTPEGNLLGHLVMGALIVDKACDYLEISDEIRTTVQHMLISHHGKPEYGAAKVPMILEAQVLNLIDDLSAKIYEFKSAAENIDPGTFSPKIFALGNIQVYKPDI